MYSQSDWFLAHFSSENQRVTQNCVAFVVHFQTFLPKSVRNSMHISDTFTTRICTQHKHTRSLFVPFSPHFHLIFLPHKTSAQYQNSTSTNPPAKRPKNTNLRHTDITQHLSLANPTLIARESCFLSDKHVSLRAI
jgi:hypothetical protein